MRHLRPSRRLSPVFVPAGVLCRAMRVNTRHICTPGRVGTHVDTPVFILFSIKPFITLHLFSPVYLPFFCKAVISILFLSALRITVKKRILFLSALRITVKKRTLSLSALRISVKKRILFLSARLNIVKHCILFWLLSVIDNERSILFLSAHVIPVKKRILFSAVTRFTDNFSGLLIKKRRIRAVFCIHCLSIHAELLIFASHFK